MQKFKIEKLEGTIAYIESLEVEQINTADFIIFRVDEGIALEEVKRIIDGLKLKGITKTFLILPKQIEYCVFKKGK
jgi:fructose-specific phosphotransferase system component IIB